MLSDAEIRDLVSLIKDKSHPNTNALVEKLRVLDSLTYNVKFFGYELARTIAAALPPRTNLSASHVGLRSKPSTQADLESDWVAYWCSELKIPVVFHRKLWELAYILQGIFEKGHIHVGARGLGFGCGVEPIPSLLASRGVQITVTDLHPELSIDKGWSNTNQHTATLEHSYRSDLVARADFERNVTLQYVDMNNIDADLRGYDFCWSICALEHLGTIENGLNFIENSLDTLRPGGTALHTTEFNFTNDSATIDNWGTVLFQKAHFQALADRLRAKGHTVAELDFDVGSKPLDRFIDVPPWDHDMSEYMRGVWGVGGPAHIKLSVDGFPCTCFGMIVTKAQ